MVALAKPSSAAPGKKPRRQKKSPAQKAARLTGVVAGFRRAQVDAVECSARWADDLWHGLDRDYLGRATGRGEEKSRCIGHGRRPGCLRFTPPQDLKADPAAAPWPPAPNVQGPPPPLPLLCTDCAMAHWDRRSSPGTDVVVERGVKMTLAGHARLGEYANVTFTDVYRDDDRSPTTQALDAMAQRGETGPEQDRLPAGGGDDDDGRLALAVDAYRAVAAEEGGAAAQRKFEDMSGETAAAEVQRRRYRAFRRVTI